MSDAGSLTAERVGALVLENRVIRAPYYEREIDPGVEFTDLDRGLQWGADVIPALQGVFRVERDPRDEHPDGWVGFARHWRGGTLRLDFDLFEAPDDEAPILVVTAIQGRAGETSIEDEAFGTVELPGEVPSEDEWAAREKAYQAARRKDDSDGATALDAFVASLPGWKRDVARRFDEIIEAEVPGVRRAVKWHQPFYGVEDAGWFASFNAFTNHVKLTFISETYLDPQPPTGNDPSRQALDVTESDTLDEELVASWVRQAADTPGMGW